MKIEPLEGRCLLSGTGLSIPVVPAAPGLPAPAVVLDRLAAPLSGLTAALAPPALAGEPSIIGGLATTPGVLHDALQAAHTDHALGLIGVNDLARAAGPVGAALAVLDRTGGALTWSISAFDLVPKGPVQVLVSPEGPGQVSTPDGPARGLVIAPTAAAASDGFTSYSHDLTVRQPAGDVGLPDPAATATVSGDVSVEVGSGPVLNPDAADPQANPAGLEPGDGAGLGQAFLDLLARARGVGDPIPAWASLAQLVILLVGVPAYVAVRKRVSGSGAADEGAAGRRRPSRTWYPAAPDTLSTARA